LTDKISSTFWTKHKYLTFDNAVDQMVGDVRQYMAKLGLRIDEVKAKTAPAMRRWLTGWAMK
jgi:hypothetical protein